jgi:peptidoglycan/xylan/chitin deacetylase (PgdA/CDA1 family)
MSAQRVPVLMYHRVGTINDVSERKYCIPAERFAQHMQALADAGWHAVTIGDFFAWLNREAALPDNAFLLTFDDGFLGVHEYAAPILAALRWPATVFLVSQMIGQRDAWRETHRSGNATYPLMNTQHIHELRTQGFSFHSHTRSHADLTSLDDDALDAQLRGSREDLQALLGDDVAFLAYPYGRHDERVLRAAQAAGYRAAFSVQPGFNRPDVDRYRIRRLDVFGTDSAAALRRKITLGSNDGSIAEYGRSLLRRVAARLS